MQNKVLECLLRQKKQNISQAYSWVLQVLMSAPSRPHQDNPFISSDGNTLNMAFGFSIRQNLNFNQMKTNLKRAELEMDRLYFQQKAIQDKVMLEVREI